jgi:hypothetical protein
MDPAYHTHSGRIKLFLLDPNPVFKDLLPPLFEKPRPVPTTPSLLRYLLHVPILIVASHDPSQLGELFDHLLLSS